MTVNCVLVSRSFSKKYHLRSAGEYGQPSRNSGPVCWFIGKKRSKSPRWCRGLSLGRKLWRHVLSSSLGEKHTWPCQWHSRTIQTRKFMIFGVNIYEFPRKKSMNFRITAPQPCIRPRGNPKHPDPAQKARASAMPMGRARARPRRALNALRRTETAAATRRGNDPNRPVAISCATPRGSGTATSTGAELCVGVIAGFAIAVFGGYIHTIKEYYGLTQTQLTTMAQLKTWKATSARTHALSSPPPPSPPHDNEAPPLRTRVFHGLALTPVQCSFGVHL